MGAGLAAAAVGGTWTGWGGWAGWADGPDCPGWDAGPGGIPAGRAARPPPDDPRWGFLSCERLFFRDMRWLRRVEFSANVDKRLTRPTGCGTNSPGYKM
jgi:hypothetical protein